MPEWCLNPARDYILSQSQEGVLDFYPLPRAAADTLAVFSNFGMDGRIDIPKEGVAEIQKLLPRIGALAPIQGELSGLGGSADLARVNGDPTPRPSPPASSSRSSSRTPGFFRVHFCFDIFALTVA